MSEKVKEFVRRISSQEIDIYPKWDLSTPLARLPVPDLASTLTCYLDILEPIVSASQFENTKIIVEKFGAPGGMGEMLQQNLKDFASKQQNWVNDFWLSDMYLENQLPLPINSNPGMVFPRQTFNSEREQLRFAAQLIAGILDYKTILDDRGLPIDRASHHQPGQPLCMEQYYRLFSSYRRPGETKDELLTNIETEMDELEYIVVACKNQFFTMELNKSGSRPSEEDLYNQLRRIVSMSEDKYRQEDIGILTALPRNKWASIRQYLLSDPINALNIEKLEKCIFLLCLDKSIPLSFNQSRNSVLTEQGIRDDESNALQLLHGMGSQFNAANRWYDKTMQFVVSADGNCGLNYEHSVAEGIAVIRLIEHILQYMEEVKARRLVRFPSVVEVPCMPQKLKWRVDDHIKDCIANAKKELDRLADNLDIYILRCNHFGRDFPKKVNMSPDSFIQLALQLTHYKIHNCLVPTYESASIRRFHLGRVDVIRSASKKALEWCKSMTNSNKTNEEKVKLLRDAIEWQTKMMLNTILGKGVDNHLLGLREIAKLHSIDDVELFTDNSYRESNAFRLSTSQVPTTMDAFLSYGAVVEQGYGAAYNPHPDYIVVAISCWRTCEDTSTNIFADKLQETFMEMFNILTNEKK